MTPLIPACERFLMHEEGCRLRTYDDHDGTSLTLVNGIWRRPNGAECLGFPTLGWGRRVWPGETLQTCTQDQADTWFRAMLASTYLPAVDRYWPDANDYQRGGLCSYGYNAGTGALVSSGFKEAYATGLTVLQKLWCSSRVTSKGIANAVLVGRRAREFALFCHPVEEQIDTAVVLASVADMSAKIIADLPSLTRPAISDD